MTTVAGLWRIELRVALRHAPAFAGALEDLADAVSWDTPEDARPALLQAFAATEPDIAEVRAALAAAAEALGIAAPAADVQWLAPRDWLAENRRDFPPLDVGRFHIRGSHVEEPPPLGRIVIHLDAATAFGSGRHATTAGCLLALQKLVPRRPLRALDMGCGSGILAIAMARLWPASTVLASDIDAEAVRVTAANARENGVGRRVSAVVSSGYRALAVRQGGPYDVIAANILARPLKAMAGDLARALAPGGAAVLSGLLARDMPLVLAAHRARDLRLAARSVIDDWATLVVVKEGNGGRGWD